MRVRWFRCLLGAEIPHSVAVRVPATRLFLRVCALAPSCAAPHSRWSCPPPLPAGSDYVAPEGTTGDHPWHHQWVRWFGYGLPGTTLGCSFSSPCGLCLSEDRLPPEAFFAISRTFMTEPDDSDSPLPTEGHAGLAWFNLTLRSGERGMGPSSFGHLPMLVRAKPRREDSRDPWLGFPDQGYELYASKSGCQAPWRNTFQVRSRGQP